MQKCPIWCKAREDSNGGDHWRGRYVLERVERNKMKRELRRAIGWFLAIGIVAAYLSGCGGSGGGSSTTVNRGSIPPAAPPVCTNFVRPDASQLGGLVGGGRPNVLVPTSSVPRAVDAGIRAHTNHLILVRSAATRDPGPSGISPSQLRTAYGVPANAGSGAIAIVDAFNGPTALADFNTFSTTFGLPTEPSSQATASTNSVFQVVYAGGSVPTDDGGWAQEIAVDTQWAHAMAPRAKIFLVEAASSNLSDLMVAVGVAKHLPGVRQVGISFGTTEDACSLVNYDSAFIQSGVSFYAAVGDTSGERDFPAMSANVIGVGGTTLNTASDGTWVSESVWDSTGGGISSFEPRPVFQDVVEKIVGGYRANADIAALADPQTGVSVYDSFPYQGSSGWSVFGGTSTATPIIAGIANASGAVRSSSQDQNTKFYAGIRGPNFHDITVGSSGTLSATLGWDFPTGVGTPNGTGGF